MLEVECKCAPLKSAKGAAPKRYDGSNEIMGEELWSLLEVAVVTACAGV